MAGVYPHLSFSKEVPLTPRRSRNGFGSKVKCDNPKEHGRNLQKQGKHFIASWWKCISKHYSNQTV